MFNYFNRIKYYALFLYFVLFGIVCQGGQHSTCCNPFLNTVYFSVFLEIYGTGLCRYRYSGRN